MSLEARNLAFNNVAHVGAEVVQAKREEWTAASQALRAQRPEHLDLAYAPGERTRWDLYPAADPMAPCFVHIHGGYWQRGSKEIFACLAEGVLAHGWSAALPGYTLAPGASLTQITAELRTAFDWLEAEAAGHGIAGPVIVTGWSAGGHLTALILDHPKVAAGLAISGVFELAPLRDLPHVNDQVRLTETEIETLSPMRRPGVRSRLRSRTVRPSCRPWSRAAGISTPAGQGRICRAIWCRSSGPITSRSWTGCARRTAG